MAYDSYATAHLVLDALAVAGQWVAVVLVIVLLWLLASEKRE